MLVCAACVVFAIVRSIGIGCGMIVADSFHLCYTLHRRRHGVRLLLRYIHTITAKDLPISIDPLSSKPQHPIHPTQPNPRTTKSQRASTWCSTRWRSRPWSTSSSEITAAAAAVGAPPRLSWTPPPRWVGWAAAAAAASCRYQSQDECDVRCMIRGRGGHMGRGGLLRESDARALMVA